MHSIGEISMSLQNVTLVSCVGMSSANSWSVLINEDIISKTSYQNVSVAKCKGCNIQSKLYLCNSVGGTAPAGVRDNPAL